MNLLSLYGVNLLYQLKRYLRGLPYIKSGLMLFKKKFENQPCSVLN